MENPNTTPERMREIEIFGVPALFMGAVLTPVPIPVLADGPRDLKPGDLVMDTGAGYYTPAEFEEKYLSPDYDDGTRAERYGKES